MKRQLGFRKQTIKARRELREPVEEYSVTCDGVPIRQSLELVGPATGIRYQLDGHPDFSSIAELAKGLQLPGMTDHEKALAVYRFSSRYAYSMSMGFGSYEATRFLNCHGYAFCWGQSDFQHLLYEAMGLRARAPALKGHSSVEVLLDGQWCTFDAYTRNLHPSPDLSGIAAGADLRDYPEMIGAIFPDEEAVKLAGYWSEAGPGTDSYEPWQDSRSMALNLRRNERLRLELDRREVWCLAPSEPMDYANGTWEWEPVLDQEHLQTEVECADGVEVTVNGLAARSPAEVEYRVQSPYPLVAGVLSVGFDDGTRGQVLVSRDARRTWQELGPVRGDSGEWQLGEEHLSVREVPSGAEPATMDHGAVHELYVRFGWSEAVLSRIAFRFDLQAHARSLPRMIAGENRWRVIGGDRGATVIHWFTTYPGLSVVPHIGNKVEVGAVAQADRLRFGRTAVRHPQAGRLRHEQGGHRRSPYPGGVPLALEGSEVVLEAEVCNRGEEPASNVKVCFRQPGTSETLGETTLDNVLAGGTATARVNWTAKAIGDRPAQNASGPPRYVETRVEAFLPEDCVEDDAYGTTAETRLSIRPRPVPRITGDLLYVGQDAGEGPVVVRAALANMPPECLCGGSHVYVSDSPLCGTLRLWQGHPDQDGATLGPARELHGILPTEFAVAEWHLGSAEMPNSFDLWLEVQCGEEVRPEDRRILLHRAASQTLFLAT